MSILRQLASVAALGVVALTTSSARAVDFDTEIVPVFTKAGCNAGSCHGAAAGRGGFKLSLLGGDPAADHDTIVFERKGRRVNLAQPAESLLLAKPTGDLPHEGGIRLEVKSAGEKRLLDWIAAGAPRPKSQRVLTHFDVAPADSLRRRSGLASVESHRPVRRRKAGRRGVTVFPLPIRRRSSRCGRYTGLPRRGRHIAIARFRSRRWFNHRSAE